MTKGLKSGALWIALIAGLWSPVMPALLRAQASLPFDGQRAFEDIRHLVTLGPRPPGSEALAESRRWIIHQLLLAGCQVEQDAFTASTPGGTMNMTNIIAKLPGERPSVILLAGHYDTKLFTSFRFVGANDGGSSAAFLLEMARVLGRRRNKYTYWLVFFDGEEAFAPEMSSTDGTYGSRHLEQKLAANGELDRIKAMILVDMIGDKHLDIRRDIDSTGWLNDVLFRTANRLGYKRYFLEGEPLAVGDDHTPFVEAGVSAVDIIDFDYGPDNSYWHTAQDTLDKCSPRSMEIVGRVVTAMLQELDNSPHIH